jgi:hypothetical protein
MFWFHVDTCSGFMYIHDAVAICSQAPQQMRASVGHFIGALYVFCLAWLGSLHMGASPLWWKLGEPPCQATLNDMADELLCEAWRRLKETGQADPRRLAGMDPEDEDGLAAVFGSLFGREILWTGASMVRWFRQLVVVSASGASFLHSQVTRRHLSWLPNQVSRGSEKRRRGDGSQRARREESAPPKPRSMRWPTSLERQLAVTVGPKARLDMEERGKGKRARRLHSVVVSAHLPSSLRFGLLVAGEEIRRKWARVVRARTLRSRVRAAEKISKWSQLNKGVDWPRDEEDFENYLTDLLLENRVRSVFEKACLGFMMVETFVGVPESSQISTRAPVKALGEDLITERSKGVMSEEKQAPQLLAMFVLEFESMIRDESAPLFKRGYAFSKLVALWTGLRSDDQTWIVPQSMVLGEFGLWLALRQTKTTALVRRFRCLGLSSLEWHGPTIEDGW